MANRPVVSDDYAYLPIPRVGDLYYGYEETTEDNEWCFRARLDTGTLIVRSASELGVRDEFDVFEGLLRGVMYLGEHHLIISPWATND